MLIHSFTTVCQDFTGFNILYFNAICEDIITVPGTSDECSALILMPTEIIPKLSIPNEKEDLLLSTGTVFDVWNKYQAPNSHQFFKKLLSLP